MRVLSVPGAAVAIVNGALPPAFEAGKGDIWVLEFIFGVSGTPGFCCLCACIALIGLYVMQG